MQDPHQKLAAQDAAIRDMEGQLQTSANEQAILRQQLQDQNRLANPEIVTFVREIATSQSKYAKRAKELLGDDSTGSDH